MSYRQPSNQDQPPPDPAEHQRRRRKKRITAGAILGGAASIGVILTLFIMLTQQPQQQNNVPTNVGQNTPALAYPVNVETRFLNSCEANGPQKVCQCSLNWFEQHVPLSQFEEDIEQGGLPVDISNVEQACG